VAAASTPPPGARAPTLEDHGAQPLRRGAQKSPGTKITGHKNHRAQKSPGTKITGHKNHRAQKSPATKITGHKNHRPQKSPATQPPAHEHRLDWLVLGPLP
jgi:hypothetical protein